MALTKNVLYISYDGMTDSLGQSQVIPYLIGLTKKGYQFTILSCEKKENYEKNKQLISNLLSVNNIKWEPIFYTKTPPVLSTLYDIYILKKKARSLHISEKFDLIHCRSYISTLAGQWMKKRYDVPFVFDMRGFWADERVDGGLWDLKNPLFRYIYRYFKKKEIQFLNESAAVVSLTEKGKNEISTWKGLQIKPNRITVIPCCVDIEHFDPAKIDPEKQSLLKQKLNITADNLIIGYLGSIGTWYLLNEMMEFFACLKKQIPLAKFLFVTHDNEASVINAAKSQQLNVEDIIITRANRNEVPLMVSLFNYGLFFIKPSYSKMASSPTKHGEIMAMDIPVICNSGVGDTDKVISKYQSGIIIENYQFGDAVDVIGKKIDLSSDLRANAIAFFGLEKGVESYANVYSNVFSSK